MSILFLNIELMNKNYDSEQLMTLIFGSIPILLFGYLFIFLGNKSKKKEKDKIRLATKARVINKRIVEEEDVEGYLRKIKYVFTLEYLNNGIRQVSDFESMFDYDYSYDLDVIVKDGKVKEILNEVSKESIDDYNSLNLKIYNILFGIGKFILVFGVVFIVSELLGDIFSFLFLGYILFLLYKLMKFCKNKVNEYNSNLYESNSVEVIKIKKKVNKKHRKEESGSYYVRTYRHYYPVIHYEDNGVVRKKVVYENINVGLVKVGDKINVLINRRDNKVTTKKCVELVKMVYKIIAGLFIFMMVMTVIDIIKYFV